MFGGANTGAMRRSQNHWARKPPLRSVAESGGVVHQLVDAGIKESHELDLTNRFEPLSRHAHAESADERFRQRRVENAFGTEALLQPGGGAEDAAIYANILSKHHDIGIICEGPGKRQI